MSNITLPKNYGCDLAKQSSVGKTILTSSREVSDGSSNDDVELVNYHRHCQATVLSAYGINGQGATWSTINSLNLSNLPNNWINEFMVDGNVTDDFAAILKILNSSIGNVKGDIEKMQDGKIITLTTKFGNSGKSDQFVFDTVKTKFPGENLTITLPDIQVNTGLEKTSNDVINLKPATQDEIGGIKIENNDGLEWVGSDTPSLKLKPATQNEIGGVKIDPNGGLEIDENGSLKIGKVDKENPILVQVLDFVYPVGSIYISVQSELPDILKNSGNWQRLGNGRCLWNTTVSNELGKELNGILPNHTHNYQYVNNSKYGPHDHGSSHWGATEDATTTLGTIWGATNVQWGNTLRPPSIGVSMWQRVS